MIAVEETGQRVGDGGGGSPDEDGLGGTAEPSGAYELSLERTEEGEGEEGDDDGELERFQAVAHQHVGEQWDNSPGNI